MKDGDTALKTVPCVGDKNIGVFFSGFGGSESTIEEETTICRNSGVVPGCVLVPVI